MNAKFSTCINGFPVSLTHIDMSGKISPCITIFQAKECAMALIKQSSCKRLDLLINGIFKGSVLLKKSLFINKDKFSFSESL